jgi:hypothetical protein
MIMKKVFALTVLAFCAEVTVYAQSGMVKELVGTVELKKPGAANFVPAGVGDTLTQDTIVSTGFKSTALITVGSSSIIVRPLTRLTLAELNSGEAAETINVNLQTGRVRVDVNPPAGTRTNMTVRGPSATASVRGTGFDFDTRNLAVRHGKVSFQGNKGGVMRVSAGSTSTVESNGKAADPITATTGTLTPPPPAGTGSAPAAKRLPALAKFTVELEYSLEER